MLRPVALSTIDLHCHSDRSDGALDPSALVARAASRGVRTLALTDHDTLDGLEQAREAACRHAMELIDGVEISVTWNARTLHVLGLKIDPSSRALREGLSAIRAGRLQRAESMGRRLAEIGIAASFEGALARVANPGNVGRTHFARYLIESGVVKDMKSAFRRFLGEGKPGYVRHRWATLAQALDWIEQAGGIAVLAHPGRYGLRVERLRALFEEFRSLGGAAVEVVTASHSEEQRGLIARLAHQTGLLASVGSDFHAPEESWLDLGALAPLPLGCDAVWHDWRLLEPVAVA